MAIERKDRVSDTSTTTGTGTLTLTGTAPDGYRSFTSAHTTGATVRYAISMGTEWEVGEGVFTTSGNTLTRATVLASSNSGSLVNFSAGTKTVVSTLTAGEANNFTAETAWTDYSGSSTIVGWSSFTTKLIYYKDIGKTRFVSFYLAGTSNSASTNFTVPNASSNTVPVTSIARAQNNGAEEATGLVNLGANSAQVDCYRTLLASWTSSGTKLSAGQFTYQLP